MAFSKYSDQEISWLKTSHKSTKLSNKLLNDNKVTITHIKNNILETNNIMCGIVHMEERLRQEADKLSVQDWNVGIEKIEFLKTKLQQNIDSLDNPLYIKRALHCITKHKIKRLALSKKVQELKFKKKNNILRKLNLNNEIDGLLKEIENKNKLDLQKIIERKESSSILSDVKSRIVDAQNWLGIIHPLTELRKLRHNAAIARGEQMRSSSEKNFTKIMEQLKEIWEAMLERYTNEEKKMKNSLEKHYQQDNNNDYLEEWHKVIFGEIKVKDNKNQTELLDVEEFCALRSCWDQFITSPTDTSGSKIPIGSVIPAAPSSMLWKKYLIEDL